MQGKVEGSPSLDQRRVEVGTRQTLLMRAPTCSLDGFPGMLGSTIRASPQVCRAEMRLNQSSPPNGDPGARRLMGQLRSGAPDSLGGAWAILRGLRRIRSSWSISTAL